MTNNSGKTATNNSRKSATNNSGTYSSVLRILQQNLNCEVRQGKGSEIVIYRQGGHHFRLGHHKRNPLVHAPILKNILKHVGIELHEWFKAAAGG